jgi:hypothetical protein
MPLAPHHPATEAESHAALIAALDAGDLAGAERARAELLTTACAGCAALLADLGAIRGAMTSLPVPVRRRDYRLSPEDAARLRPSAWRRFLQWLAAPGSTVRPLATGLATLGVVGLLLTAGLPGLGGLGVGRTSLSAVGAPAENAASGDAQTEGFGATSAPALAPMPGASATPREADPGSLAGDSASPAPTGERSSGVAGAEGPDEKAATADTAGDTGLPAGVVLSLALLLGGLGLFGARIVARRRPA